MHSTLKKFELILNDKISQGNAQYGWWIQTSKGEYFERAKLYATNSGCSAMKVSDLSQFESQTEPDFYEFYFTIFYNIIELTDIEDKEQSNIDSNISAEVTLDPPKDKHAAQSASVSDGTGDNSAKEVEEASNTDDLVTSSDAQEPLTSSQENLRKEQQNDRLGRIYRSFAPKTTASRLFGQWNELLHLPKSVKDFLSLEFADKATSDNIDELLYFADVLKFEKLENLIVNKFVLTLGGTSKKQGMGQAGSDS